MNSVTDPWINKNWKMYAVTEDMDELKVNGSLPHFQLQRQPGPGPAGYALIPVVPTTLPKCLSSSVRLTQAGEVPPGPVSCDPLLPAPFGDDTAPYWDVSHQVLRDERDLLRLEGAIQMADGLKSISLYLLDNVLTGKKKLLIFDIEASQANPDGTIIGHD